MYLYTTKKKVKRHGSYHTTTTTTASGRKVNFRKIFVARKMRVRSLARTVIGVEKILVLKKNINQLKEK